MAITNATITESVFTNPDHHANTDKNDANLHKPQGFRDATSGSRAWKSELIENKWEQFGHLPACLDYVSPQVAPPDETSGNIYLLTDAGTIFTLTSIAWQSANTVRYTYSGSPDLSGVATGTHVVYIYGSGIANSAHLGRFLMTTVNDGSDYFEIDNPLVTDASLDETGLSNASTQHPLIGWDGAANGEWVRFDGTDWYRIEPSEGLTCYDKTLLMNRTFNGSKWLGDSEVLAITFGDETTAHTTGTAKTTFHMPHKAELKEVVAGLVTAATGTTLFTVDLNDDGTSVFSTVVTLDASEKISTTAATPAVISNPTIAAYSLMTVDIDAIGSTLAGVGGKIYLKYNRI